MAFGPLLGYAIDRMDAWYATMMSIVVGTVFLAVQVGAGGVHVAAIVVAGFGYDIARQSLAVSLSAAVFAWVLHFLFVFFCRCLLPLMS